MRNAGWATQTFGTAVASCDVLKTPVDNNLEESYNLPRPFGKARSNVLQGYFDGSDSVCGALRACIQLLEFVATDNDTFVHPVVDALLAMLDVATRVDWAHYGILLLNYIDLFLRVFHTVANRARQCCAKPVRCSGLPAS